MAELRSDTRGKALYERVGDPSLRLRLCVSDLLLISHGLLLLTMQDALPPWKRAWAREVQERIARRLRALDPGFAPLCLQEDDHA